MAGKKPVSAEEKRKRAVDFLMEKREFFMLRELEKMLAKEKGIVSQAVKDVIQSLVDDRLICSERVGQSNYFWCFPSTAVRTRAARRDTMQGEIAKLALQRADLEKQAETASLGKESSPARDELTVRLSAAQTRHAALMSELASMREMDPAAFAENKRQLLVARMAADRWTDQIMTLQSHCANAFGVARSDFCTQFEIPEDMDYLPAV